MRYEYGIAAIVALGTGFFVWHRTKKHATKLAPVAPNVETTNAGNDVPSVPLSNSPAPVGTAEWLPFYLAANYPVERGGNNVIPSTVVGSPNWQFGPQEIIPSL